MNLYERDLGTTSRVFERTCNTIEKACLVSKVILLRSRSIYSKRCYLF
jgi:hypothetical protein